MLAAIGDATTCPHGHPIVEGARDRGRAAGRRRGGRQACSVLRFENEAEDLLHLPQWTPGCYPGLEGTLGSADEDEVTIDAGGEQPLGHAQRGGDRVGDRRPLTPAAHRAAGQAGADEGSLRAVGARSVSPGNTSMRARPRDRRAAPIASPGCAPAQAVGPAARSPAGCGGPAGRSRAASASAPANGAVITRGHDLADQSDQPARSAAFAPHLEGQHPAARRGCTTDEARQQRACRTLATRCRSPARRCAEARRSPAAPVEHHGLRHEVPAHAQPDAGQDEHEEAADRRPPPASSTATKTGPNASSPLRIAAPRLGPAAVGHQRAARGPPSR